MTVVRQSCPFPIPPGGWGPCKKDRGHMGLHDFPLLGDDEVRRG